MIFWTRGGNADFSSITWDNSNNKIAVMTCSMILFQNKTCITTLYANFKTRVSFRLPIFITSIKQLFKSKIIPINCNWSFTVLVFHTNSKLSFKTQNLNLNKLSNLRKKRTQSHAFGIFSFSFQKGTHCLKHGNSADGKTEEDNVILAQLSPSMNLTLLYLCIFSPPFPPCH